ncbi:MAG: MFS transporter, partial [Bradyrhizobium sp.]|nr:MFS transporter [Bradyrhizobium sp.]
MMRLLSHSLDRTGKRRGGSFSGENRTPRANMAALSVPSRQSLRGLDWFIFFLADVQTGFGPFIAV